MWHIDLKKEHECQMGTIWWWAPVGWSRVKGKGKEGMNMIEVLFLHI
jgi:hypothetical protein